MVFNIIEGKPNPDRPGNRVSSAHANCDIEWNTAIALIRLRNQQTERAMEALDASVPDKPSKVYYLVDCLVRHGSAPERAKTSLEKYHELNRGTKVTDLYKLILAEEARSLVEQE